VLYGGAILASRTDFVRTRIESMVSRSTGYDVRVGSAGLDWDLDARAVDVAVAAAGRAPFLTAAAIEGRGLLRALIGRGAARVLVAAPRLRLAAWEPPRRTDADRAAARPVALPPWIGHVDLRDGFVESGSPERTVALGPIDVTASAVEASTDLRLAGTSSLPGASGDLTWSARIAPGGADLTAKLRIEVDALGGFADALDFPLPAPIDEGGAALDVDVDGAIGAPLAVSARGDAMLGPGAPPLALEGSGALDLGGGRLSFTVRTKVAEPKRAVAFGSSEVRLGEGSVTGKADLASGATDAKVVLAGAGWKDAEGAIAAEGIALRGDVAVAPVGSQAERALRLDLVADGGELLLASRYYLDLTAVPIGAAGVLRAVDGGVSWTDGAITARGIGRASGTGTWTRSAPTAPSGAAAAVIAADLRLDVTDISRAFAVAVRDPWKEAFPILAEADVRGALSGPLRVGRDASGAMSIAGRLRWNGSAAIASPDVRIGEVALELPLLLGAASAAAERPGKGKLAGISVGGVEVGPVEHAIAASPDRLSLVRAAEVAALDGDIALTELAAAALTSGSPELQIGLRASGLRLAPIATAVGLPAFAGVITAAIPRARLAGGTLETEGDIVLEVFGGTVRLQRVHATDIGSGIATLALDATFDDISLGELTEVLDIGHISGVARGAVEGLEVQAGTPVRFSASLETVERSGVPQRIGVAAIRRLSILGGSGGDPFSSGVLSFFDEFGYARIGFRCTLEGDRLTLEGIEQRDGEDYLVIGSLLPPRVDVVSHTRIIAFSEMVSRLQRASEGEGPRVE
jgi:hypothetical protein